MRKKIIRLVIGLVIIGGLVFGIFYAYVKTEKQNISISLDSIEANIAEIAAIKEIGDLLAAKKTPPMNYTWQEVENLSTTMASQISNLETNYRLAEYKKAGTIWAVKIREAAKDQKTWKDLPAMPSEFTVALRDSEAEESFYKSLARVFELVQFGTDAIRRGDRETMRYVAAKLLVQDHWLTGLANRKKAGIFAELVSPAYAAQEQEDNTFKELEKRKEELEENLRDIKNTQESVRSLMRAALGYYMAEKTNNKALANEWVKATQDTIVLINQLDVGSQVLTELANYAEEQTMGQQFKKEFKKSIVVKKDQAPKVITELAKSAEKEPPLQVKIFRDDCFARGGVLGGIDRTNEFLQTVEDGFYCHFHQDGEKCWRFLSYSGSIGAGGEPDCEQDNVLPTPTGPNKALAKTRPPSPEPVAQAPTTPKETTTKTQTQTPVSSKTQTPTPSKTPAPTPTKTPLRDLGTPTGTGAPKMEFTTSQTNFNAQVGEKFSYSFCQPAVTRTSDLCSASSTNPKYGLPPYTFSLGSGSGFPPYGISLNLNGLLEGTPTAAGSRTFSVCAKDTGGFSVCRSVTVNVAQKVVTGTVSISSGSCAFQKQHQGYNIFETIYDYNVLISGSASGSEGVRVDLRKYTTIPVQVDCGSWTSSTDEYSAGAICIRQAGQPESTSWSMQYEFEGFSRPEDPLNFTVQVQDSYGIRINSAYGSYPCE